jgi:hypothetical protein
MFAIPRGGVAQRLDPVEPRDYASRSASTLSQIRRRLAGSPLEIRSTLPGALACFLRPSGGNLWFWSRCRASGAVASCSIWCHCCGPPVPSLRMMPSLATSSSRNRSLPRPAPHPHQCWPVAGCPVRRETFPVRNRRLISTIDEISRKCLQPTEDARRWEVSLTRPSNSEHSRVTLQGCGGHLPAGLSFSVRGLFPARQRWRSGDSMPYRRSWIASDAWPPLEFGRSPRRQDCPRR